jgi:hypothetical protein
LAFIAIQYPVMWVVNFPTSLHVALAFSVASMLIMVQTSLGQVMAAHGVHGAAVGVGLSLILAVLTYWSTELLIPHLGVAGCGWALVIGYGVCALVQTLLAPWYFSLPTGEGIQSEDFSSKIERD